MNKRDAKAAADSFEGTFSDLIGIIEADSKPGDGLSILNKTMTHDQAKGILYRAVLERDPEEKVKIWVPDPYSTSGRMKRSGDALIVQNIMRECATPAALKSLAAKGGE